jgi:hypothetical protein
MSTTFNGATTVVAASSSPTTLSTQDDNRGGLIATNGANMTMYVLLGSGTVSTSLYTYPIPPGATLEVPEDFVGTVMAIWPATAAGSALVTVLS